MPGGRSLDLLVTEVASQLMSVDSASMASASTAVLEQLVNYFGVHTSFLRHNDHQIHATVLVAEWPVREHVPDPDPLGVVYFADADAVFAAAEHATEPMIGPPSGDYQERVRAGSGMSAVSYVAIPLLSGSSSTGSLGLIKNGDRRWSTEEINALKAIAALFAQLQGRVKAEERLLFIASHDDLTGLSNRRALLSHMTERLAPGESGPVAALFLDLDRLKALNDFLGHVAGDEFIRKLARRLRDQTDPRDMIARLGGDEFVIIPALPITAETAYSEARRIQKLVSERVTVGGESVSRGVSIGISLGVPGETTVSDVLRQADLAVLAAKTAGGGGISMFTNELRSEYELRNDVEVHLRNSIDDDSLVLDFQPEVDLETGRIVALEALVRWNHPVRGLLQPNLFVPVAETTNLAGELGRWVIRAACAQLADWRSKLHCPDLVMRINVSPVQLVSLDFLDTVENVLSANGLPPESICLEITEHVVVRDLVRTQITLNGLAEIGVGVAIDDFGTGYSSLSHLKSLSVGALKIDRGFVRRLGVSSRDYAIVRSIVGLADSFGLQLVAEGVETGIAARTLLELGCTRAQGFLFSKPISGPEVEKLIAAGHVPISFDDPA